MGDLVKEDDTNTYSFEAKSMLTNSFQKFHEFVQNDVLCDVEIKTGMESFKCHRIVLASCSNYFHAMFTSNLAESRQKVITIGDIKASTMKQLIDFAYTAKVEITVENVQSILHAASVLQLDVLAQGCCHFMDSRLHPSNCLGIRNFAERHGYMGLVKSADVFALRHFTEVFSSDDFVAISANHLQDLLHSPDLCVSSEIQAYEALMKWLTHDLEKRKDFLPGLLAHVRLPLLPLAFLHQQIETNDLLRRNMECRDLLDEARVYKLWQADLLPATSATFIGERYRPRKSCSGLLLCVGGRGSNGEPFASVECYSPLHDCWFLLPSMSTRRRHVGCTYAAGKLYAIGGCDDKEHLYTAEVFDPEQNQWKDIAPMDVPRRGLGVCFLGGALYAIGGLNDNVFYDVVERYDISSDIWTVVSPLSTPRGGVAVAELKGRLYALGGNNGPFSLSSCECYDPHLDKWVAISPMGQNRAGAGVAQLEGKLYVVGGFDNNVPLSSAECFNPDSGIWMKVYSMHMARGGVGVATLGGLLYAVGGHNGLCHLNTVEAYDPATDRWSFVANIQLGRAGAGVAWRDCSLTYMEGLKQHEESKKPNIVKPVL